MRYLTTLVLMFALATFGGVSFSTPSEAATQAQLNAYKRDLAAYRAARAQFASKEKAYWAEISRKKQIRADRRRAGKSIKRKHYVLSQPPKYAGPKRPRHPDPGPIVKKKRKPSTLPNAKKLRASIKDLYGFNPQGSAERDFKKAYAREAKLYGISAEQVIGVYALETGGKGPFDLVSGEAIQRNKKCKLVKRGGRPLSTALGYFQLLNANTSSTVAVNARGPKEKRFANRLRAQAAREDGKRRKELRAKADLMDRVVKDMKKAISRIGGKKNNWSEYRKLGKTKLGYAVHALNLDVDIGPMIQMAKLAVVRDYARKKGLRNLSSDRLELMNLVGYPRGALMLEAVGLDVPTANFVKANEIAANYRVLGDKTVEGSIAKIRRVIDLRKKECG
ncbi:MAG: hypothetical protein AAFW47_06295, partial [Pseudomonadota bacterium]